MDLNHLNAVRFDFNEEYTQNTIKIFNDLRIDVAEENDTRRMTLASGDVEYHGCRIVEMERLNTSWREVHRIKLDKTLDFIPGDSIGLLCPNNDVLVDEIMRILDVNDFRCRIERGGVAFTYIGTIRGFFKHHFDFTSIPRKSLMIRLSRSCDEINRRYIEYLCSKEGTRDYLGMGSRWNNIVDFIRTFGCQPTLEDVIGECGMIKPRYFSLINRTGDECEVLVGMISKEFDGFTRYGHVSDYLRNYDVGEIGICLRRNILFQMRDSGRMMAICTGTGIAPFLSFVSNLQAGQTIWIVYGFRNDDDDISAMMAPDERVTITRVGSANGSRVTDYIRQNIDKIREYVGNECPVYVCGRMEMQRGVFEIFQDEFDDVVRSKRLIFDQWN